MENTQKADTGKKSAELTATQKRLMRKVRIQCLKDDNFFDALLRFLANK
jgi:hypothetical protein